MAQDRRRHAILPDHLELVNLTIALKGSATETPGGASKTSVTNTTGKGP